jgi:hypothetical protein
MTDSEDSSQLFSLEDSSEDVEHTTTTTTTNSNNNGASESRRASDRKGSGSQQKSERRASSTKMPSRNGGSEYADDEELPRYSVAQSSALHVAAASASDTIKESLNSALAVLRELLVIGVSEGTLQARMQIRLKISPT